MGDITGIPQTTSRQLSFTAKLDWGGLTFLLPPAGLRRAGVQRRQPPDRRVHSSAALDRSEHEHSRVATVTWHVRILNSCRMTREVVSRRPCRYRRLRLQKQRDQ